MAKQRIVNTRFWDDTYIASLSPNEKLLFLYLLTSSLTNISGVYELALKRVAFDVAITTEEVERAFSKFQDAGKILYEDGWIAVVRFAKYQAVNPKVKAGMILELMRAPESFVERLKAQLRSIGFYSLSDPNAYPKHDPNGNPDLKAIPKIHPAFEVMKIQEPKENPHGAGIERAGANSKGIKSIKDSIHQMLGKA